MSNTGKASYVVGSLQLSPGIPAYFKPPLYESIERAAYEKFMEDEERRLRREALGLFD